jgi:glucosamine-6-phosphate deaminase
MGINTILNAKKIILIAWGENKRKVVKKAVEENVNDLIPASFLQNHNNIQFILDSESAANLNRFTCPWLYTDIGNYLSKILSSGKAGWDKKSIKKAVIWLSIKKKKPILLLTDEDYNENGMGEIFDKYKSAYLTNILVFNMLQHTITGWPGGKPNADDSQRPERASPRKKRIILFSPHPDDDVISMGGTFNRLIQQGHDVHVAYQTSGNIAVKDSDVLEITEFIKRLVNDLSKDDFNTLMKKNITNDSHVKIGAGLHNAIKKLFEKEINLEEYKALNKIKGLIRQSEAFQGCKHLGLSNENKIHFLDLPFYQTGRIKKKDISTKDIHIVKNLIETIKPHQIYAAGDLNDPHGTHRLCLRTIYRSIDILKPKSFMKNCNVWLYRGAWKEWKTYDIDMAVPLSPDQILKKRRAIFKHRSQKDTVAYPGKDLREFWQRAEDRNKNTAEFYSNLGFAKYAAMEAFKKYRF